MKVSDLFESDRRSREEAVASDLREFGYMHDHGADEIRYEGVNYTLKKGFKTLFSGAREYTYDGRQRGEVTITEFPGHLACCAVIGGASWKGEVFIPVEFLKAYFGEITDKEAAIKHLLGLYQHVVRHHTDTEEHFNGEFLDSREYFSMVLDALPRVGVDWAELKTISKSFDQRG